MNLKGEVRLHPSSLGAILRCPPILMHEGTVELDFENEAGLVGQAVHAIGKTIVTQNLPTRPDIRPMLAEYGVSGHEDEVGWLTWKLAQRWAELKKRCTDTPEVEKHLYLGVPHSEKLEFVWSGIPDVFDVVRGRGRIIVIDWKTGRTHDERSDVAQMKAYAYLAFEAIGWDSTVPEVEVHLEWLREDEPPRPLIFTAREIEQWAHETMFYLLKYPDNRFTPSEHCAYCPHWPCEGRNELMGTAVKLFSGDIEELGNHNTSGYPQDQAQLLRAYQQANVLEDMIGKFKKQFRVDVRRFGSIKANGIEATLQHVSGGHAFDTRKTVEILSGKLGIQVDEIVNVLKVAKRDLVSLIRAKTPEGVTKKEYEENAIDLLVKEEAAIKQAGYDKVVIKKAKY